MYDTLLKYCASNCKLTNGKVKEYCSKYKVALSERIIIPHTLQLSLEILNSTLEILC